MPEKSSLRLLPLGAVLLFSAALALGMLHQVPRNDSPQIGRKISPFTVPALDAAQPFSPKLWAQRVAVLHVFASWCEACAMEQKSWANVVAQHNVKIFGLAWKDEAQKTAAWLKTYGNPYAVVGLDEEGKSTLPLGLSGVPETFVFDRDGRIAYDNKAPIDDAEVENVILPLIETLSKSDAK